MDWAYVRGDIAVEELDAHAEELRHQRQALMSRLEALALGRLDELEMTRSRLKVAQDYLNGLRQTRSGGPADYSVPTPVFIDNVEGQEPSDGLTVRIVPVAENLEGRQAQFAETWLLLPGWEGEAPPKSQPVDRTDWQLWQAMSRLQAEVFVFDDHLEFGGP